MELYQSFKEMNKCIQSNTIGSNEVFDYCLKNNIKLIHAWIAINLNTNDNLLKNTSDVLLFLKWNKVRSDKKVVKR